jgi:predicted Zn-dependent protease
MSTQSESRRQKLERFLAENPNDSFARYGIALECMREGDLAAAESQFKTLLERNPDYVPGYQMYGQMLAQNGRADEAKLVLARGIGAAGQQKNEHAKAEMQGMLDSLG